MRVDPRRLRWAAPALVIGVLASAAPPLVAQATDAATAASAMFGRHELAIHDAARMGTRADVERLLAVRAADRDARAPLGATPLHYAALNQDAGALRALLEAGADPNARDVEGRTPLHMAAFATRTVHAQWLLRAGADPLLKTHEGRDVLSMARKVRADEFAGVVSLWILKGCSKARPC